MDSTRRQFLMTALLTSGLSLTGGLESLPWAEGARPPAIPAGTDVDHKMLKFWTDQVRDPHYNHLAVQNHVHHRSAGHTATADDDASYVPVFYVWTADKGIRRATAVTPDELIPSGDASISYKLNSFKASTKDQQHRVQAGSLRFDVRQALTLPNFSEPLSWSTISSLALKAEKLPPFIENIVDPQAYWGASPSVVLPGGVGYWSYNLFVQERPHMSFFQQLFNFLREGTEAIGIVASLGIPAISATALKAMDTMYATMNAVDVVKTHNLYKAGDTAIAATQDGLGAGVDSATVTNQGPLPVRSGQYIAIPWSQTSTFESTMDKLTLVGGYLVDKGSASAAGPDLKKATLDNPDLAEVTYVTFGVAVKKATIVPAGVLGSGGTASGGGGSAGGGGGHKPAK